MHRPPLVPAVLALASLLAVGCAAAPVRYTEINARPSGANPRAPSRVAVFTTNAPEQAYTEIGLLEANEPGGSLGELISAMRARAGEAGCDGLVLKYAGDDHHRGGMTYWAACIVYGEDGDDPSHSVSLR